MLKKILSLLVMISATSTMLIQAEVRVGAQMTWEWDSEKSGIRDLEEEDLSLGGLQLEILGRNLGFGLDALADFRQDLSEQWFFDWQGQLFLRYHLFENNCFLDPFLEAAYGNAGSVKLEDTENRQLHLSLYPSLSAGLNLLFNEGLIVGGRLNYRLKNNPVPATDIETVDLGKHQATFYVGLRLGGSPDSRGRYYDRYFERY